MHTCGQALGIIFLAFHPTAPNLNDHDHLVQTDNRNARGFGTPSSGMLSEYWGGGRFMAAFYQDKELPRTKTIFFFFGKWERQNMIVPFGGVFC